MAVKEKALEKVVLSRLLKLNSTVLGLVTGIIAALVVFIATNWLLIRGGDVVGPHLALLGQFFIGYEVTFPGSIIGLVYAFPAGFLVGYCVARLYNSVVDFRERTQDRRG